MAGDGRLLVFLARRRVNLLQSLRSSLPEYLRQPLLLYQSLVNSMLLKMEDIPPSEISDFILLCKKHNIQAEH